MRRPLPPPGPADRRRLPRHPVHAALAAAALTLTTSSLAALTTAALAASLPAAALAAAARQLHRALPTGTGASYVR